MADSNDLMRRIGRVGAAIDPGLTDRDVERLVEGARVRRERRRVARVAWGAIAGGVAVAAAVLFVQAPRWRAAVSGHGVAAAPVAAPALRLADGSMATPLGEGSEISVREDAPRKVAIDLGRGRGRFEVAPRPERQFQVRAGAVTITVIGTVFTVERVADRIGVDVTRGVVRVDWGVGSQRLAAGESGWFPPLVVGEAGVAADQTAPEVSAGQAAPAAPGMTESAGSAPAPRSVSVSPSRAKERAARAHAGDEPAKAAAPAAETAESLLAAADAARLQGRAQDGAALLRKIVQAHRSDPRAPLAAFTLGRVLLMELGEPRTAAAAFAEARALAPGGPFAEDALAREVEAWAKAGDRAKAQERARDYLRIYPGGRRVPAVRALGGE